LKIAIIAILYVARSITAHALMFAHYAIIAVCLLGVMLLGARYIDRF